MATVNSGSFLGSASVWRGSWATDVTSSHSPEGGQPQSRNYNLSQLGTIVKALASNPTALQPILHPTARRNIGSSKGHDFELGRARASRPRPSNIHPVNLPCSATDRSLIANSASLSIMPSGSSSVASAKSVSVSSSTGKTHNLKDFLESIKYRAEERKSALSHATKSALVSSGIRVIEGDLDKYNKTQLRVPVISNVRRPFVGFPPYGFRMTTDNGTGMQLYTDSGGYHPTNCSGTDTRTQRLAVVTVTSTILVNETMILHGNATTPLPVFITPLPACQTVSIPCAVANCLGPVPLPKKGPLKKSPVYGPKSTMTSTLLVTKKSPAIISQGSVGRIFGNPSPSAPSGTAQPSADGAQAGGTQMRTQSESNPHSPSGETYPESEEPSVPQSSSNQHSPGSSGPAQENQPENSESSDSQRTGANMNPAQSNSNKDDQTPSNDGHSATHSGQIESQSGNIQAVNGGTSSNTAQSTGNNDDQTLSSGGNSAPNLGQIESQAGNNQAVIANSNTAQSTSKNNEQSSRGGNSVPNLEPVKSNSKAYHAGTNGESFFSGTNSGEQNEGGTDLDNNEYFSSVVNMGNVPIIVADSAVIVGSHTVNDGSPPTTVLANGQTIAAQPSQIVALGMEIPIHPEITPAPTKTLKLDSVPVVLQTDEIVLGSKTFSHGSAHTSVVYNGQTYHWDASELVGPETTVDFPSEDSVAPRVTAGGQVFSVYPSQLKGSGTNIALPNNAKASPFVYKGHTFLVNPSQLIAPDTSITLPPATRMTPFIDDSHPYSFHASQFIAPSTTIPLSSDSGVIKYEGQTLTVKPSQIIGASTTIPLLSEAQAWNAASLSAITTGGLVFSLAPSTAVIGSSTYFFLPGKAPVTVVAYGQTLTVGPKGVQFGTIDIPMTSNPHRFLAVTQGDLTFSIAPSEVILNGHTDRIRSGMAPITTIINGQTVRIGTHGVGLISTTVPLPPAQPSLSIVTKGDLIFSLAASEVVLQGKTYSVASSKAPITTAINGQAIKIGPKGIHIDGTTVDLPSVPTSVVVRADGLTFAVEHTDAVISGTTYAIGIGAATQTIVVGSETIRLGSAGVMLPTTTIPPGQTPTASITNDLTCLMEFREAIINSTTYAVGNCTIAKTLMDASEKMVLATNGVRLSSTITRLWTSAEQTGLSSVVGTSAPMVASGLPTPVTWGEKGDAEHGTGPSHRPSRIELLGLASGLLLFGLAFI